MFIHVYFGLFSKVEEMIMKHDLSIEFPTNFESLNFLQNNTIVKALFHP